MIFNNKNKINGNKVYNNPIENKQIVSFNTQYVSMSPYIESTVVKVSDNIIKSTLFSKEHRFISEQYLLNYKANNEYIGYKMGIANFFKEDAALTSANLDLGEEKNLTIQLPKATKVRTALSTVITSRRSVRVYGKNDMSIQELSNIFYYSQGVSDEVRAYNLEESSKSIKLRNSPSAGGLYPIELYAFIKNVKGLKDGIYRYYPYSHSIKKTCNSEAYTDIRKFAEFGFINAEDTNLIVFFVYNLPVNSRKYGDAGMAYAFIEVGETSQNLQLISTAIGYGACDIGGYEKQYIEGVLGLDGVSKHVVHMTIVGMEKEE